MKIKNLYKKLISITTKNTGIVLFLFMLIVATFTFKEYGISVDEPVQRGIGYENMNYILGYNEDLSSLNHNNKKYAISFEGILIIAEFIYIKLVEKDIIFEEYNKYFDKKSVYLLRHFITHLFFLLSAFFAYKLACLLYKNKWLAVVAFFLVVLHPRLYTQSFFNTKDIPFFSMFIISLYYTAIALKHKNIKNFIIIGICYGILINIRIMGIILPFLIFCFILLDMLKEKKYMFYTKRLIVLGFFTAILVYITFPYLWENPVKNFIFVFKEMVRFKHSSMELFRGNLYNSYAISNSNPIPITYIPFWFSISTPIIYLFFGLLGSILVVLNFFKKPILFLFDAKKRNLLISFFLFFAPIIIVIVLKSTLYNGWRQMYFIYAGFVFLSIYALHILIQKNKNIRYIPFIAFIFSAIFMVRAYPLQYIYFNEFIPKKNNFISKHFEMDYMGISGKQALEYILKNDNSSIIKVYKKEFGWFYTGHLLKNYRYILKKEDKKRIMLVNDINNADYFVAYSTNYAKKDSFPMVSIKKIYAIKRQKNTILDIYKIIEH